MKNYYLNLLESTYFGTLHQIIFVKWHEELETKKYI